MSISTSSKRIEYQNDWPTKIDFSAELEFQKKIEAAGGLAPFKTGKLTNVNSKDFHIYVGNLIDGLDALPHRPDYLFDHCFRIIDASSKTLTKKKKTTFAISEVNLNIFSTGKADWDQIADLMCKHMPTSTASYIATRLLDASLGKGTDAGAIVARGEKCISSKRFTEATKKYTYANYSGPGVAVNKFASFIRLLLKTSTPLKKTTKNSSSPSASTSNFSTLDLTKSANLLSKEDKIQFIITLLLFTMRNERQHGSSVSPFRTSKANLGRYASYYYAMICSYIIALGVVSTGFPKAISSSAILTNAQDNFAEFSKFFGSNAK